MPTPARLPKRAPRVLRRFVRCEVDAASLDLTDTAWLGEIPLLDGATLTATEKSGANRVGLTIDPASEFTPAFDLDISIVDGELTVTIDGMAGAAFDGPIKEWTDALNATLKENGKQFSGLSVDGSTLGLSKQPIPVEEPEEPVTPPPPVVEVPEPEPEPTEEPSGSRWGCLGGILAGVAALLVTVGVIVTSGGDDGATESIVVTDSAPAETDPPAATDSPSTTTSAPAPTTTIAQVGAVVDEPVATGMFLCALVDGLEPDTPTQDYGDLTLPDGNCDPGPGPFDVRLACGELGIPCATGDDPPLVAVGDPGTDHQTQAADAITGEQGASTREERAAYFAAALRGDIEFSATCSGRLTTGAATADAGATVDIASPLYQYGDCVDREAVLVLDGERFRFPQAEDAVVDASEPDPTPPDDYAIGSDAVSLSLMNQMFFSPANTVNNVIGGRNEVTDDCLWFFEPHNVEVLAEALDGCGSQDHFWVFAAGITDVDIELSVTDTVVGTTATYANPLGQPFAPVVDTTAFGTSGPLFDNSIFPCGFGFVAYTACAGDQPAMAAGGLVTVSATVAGTVPIAADGISRAHHVDFGSSSGPRYSITHDDDAWTVSSSAGRTRARALIRSNSITLVVPNDELPEGPIGYQWSNEADGSTLDQPVVPVMGLITTPTITAPDESTEQEPAPTAIESLADFYSQLSASIATGETTFALDRLDPLVFEVYPDSCPAALASFEDPDLVIEFIEEGPVENWIYEANGASIEVADAIAVTIRLSGRGQAGQASEAHVSIIDGEYHWFTFC